MKRRLLTLLLAAGALLVSAVTALTIPAAAQTQTVYVQLASGEIVPVQVDVPPGGSLGDIQLPGTPVPAPTTPTTPTAPTTPQAPAPKPQPEPTQPAPAPQEPGAPNAGGGSPQERSNSGTRVRRESTVKERELSGRGDSQAGDEGSRDRRGRRGGLRNTDGTPRTSNPGFVDALPGPSTASGVPNFIIRKFRVPPFLLPIYQAAGIEYGIRWEILAAINEIETDYGRNLNVSSAGALGWMQFMPPTWAAYGTDANKDGRKDPYNPVDAIFAAARYLAAAGYDQDVRRAIFAYNHADWYVDSVLLRARLIAGVPADLIGSLTGLTEGRFPVDARATYADDLEESGGSDRSIDIFAERGAPVVAINDGVIRAAGRDTLVLEDVYGNRFGYSHLGSTRAGLERGSRVIAGRVIGRVGLEADGMAPHLELSIRPGGVGAPTIDPKPILDGWKLLEATAIYRANGENVLRGGASLGQVLLLSKSLLAKRVLADDRIDVYECGREDIRAGLIDRRVLAALAYLAESGLEPTVTSLRCGHGYYTKSGNVSHHSSGNAVDIAQINGISVMGHQEPGGITDQAVRRLAQLQGALAPTQIISLFDLGGTTLSMADHADHIHVGFQPAGGESGRPHSVLKPDQWPRLLERLRDLENPEIRTSDQG
jgi:Transglycosylase SLT domain/Peptidase family M23